MKYAKAALILCQMIRIFSTACLSSLVEVIQSLGL